MSSSSSAVEANSSSSIEASNLSSSSSSPMNSQQKALDQCIAHLWKVIIQTQVAIYGERIGQLNCGISLEPCKNPVVTKCGHLFDKANIEQWWSHQPHTKTCPTCKFEDPGETTPVHALKDIDRVPEDFILTCSKFKKTDVVKAGALISIAEELIAEKDFSGASKLLSTALSYTNSSADYSFVLKLYDAWKAGDKACLSRLYLSFYQLQESRIDEAMKTLSCCDKNIVDPAQLLAAIKFHTEHGSQHTQDYIALVKGFLDDNIKEAEDKIFLCQQILTLDPFQFDVHGKLIDLTADASEKRRLCSIAARFANEIGNADLEKAFLEGLKDPAAPASITKEQWMNADQMKLPPYPPELEAFLEEVDPYDPTKKKRETHIVVPLFPDVMDENGSTTPLTLDSLNRLDKNPDGTNGYEYLWDKIPAKNIVAERKFRYGVMMKDVIPGSRNKKYEDQVRLLPAGYKVPKMLDAARAILWENQRTKTRHFTRNPWTYTRCSDDPTEGWRLVVGGFAPSGLRVYYVHDYDDDERIGVAGWREF